MQVDVLHRDDLCVAAPGRAALHAEDRPERWFAQADHRLLADMIESVAQPDRRSRLALARGRGADRRNENELRVRPRLQAVEVFKRHLGLVMPVGFQVFFCDAELGERDLGDASLAGGMKLASEEKKVPTGLES